MYPIQRRMSVLNKIKKRYNKKDKKGLGAIEFVVIMTIFIMILGFFIDAFIILNQHYVASREVNIVTRQIAMQGGVNTSEPTGYNRFGQDYGTGVVIHKRLNKRLGGVDIDGYRVLINPQYQHGGWQELTTASQIELDYQENFELTLQYKYEWFITGQLIPGVGGERTRTLIRSSVSELGGTAQYD